MCKQAVAPASKTRRTCEQTQTWRLDEDVQHIIEGQRLHLDIRVDGVDQRYCWLEIHAGSDVLPHRRTTWTSRLDRSGSRIQQLQPPWAHSCHQLTWRNQKDCYIGLRSDHWRGHWGISHFLAYWGDSLGSFICTYINEQTSSSVVVEHNMFAAKLTTNADQCGFTKIRIPDDLFGRLRRLNEHVGMLGGVRTGVEAP